MKMPFLLTARFKNWSVKRRLAFGLGVLFVLYIPRMVDRIEAAFNGGLPIPEYEPFPDSRVKPLEGDTRDSVIELVAFLRARMESHHVSADRANQLLWQFHYFVPVKYYPEQCKIFGVFEKWDDQISVNRQIESLSGVYRDVEKRYSLNQKLNLANSTVQRKMKNLSLISERETVGAFPFPVGTSNSYGLSNYNPMTIISDLFPHAVNYVNGDPRKNAFGNHDKSYYYYKYRKNYFNPHDLICRYMTEKERILYKKLDDNVNIF